MDETPSSSATRVMVALRPEDRPPEAACDRLRSIIYMIHWFNVKSEILERLEERLSSAKAKDGGSRRWWALILLCVAQFVDVLDINAVIVALPTIGRELGFSHGDLQWVVTSYVLLFGGFLLLAGRLADLFGRRKMFAVGLALFAASSLLCGYAWSPLVL